MNCQYRRQAEGRLRDSIGEKQSNVGLPSGWIGTTREILLGYRLRWLVLSPASVVGWSVVTRGLSSSSFGRLCETEFPRHSARRYRFPPAGEGKSLLPLIPGRTIA
jgi:hypothetical protein